MACLILNEALVQETFCDAGAPTYSERNLMTPCKLADVKAKRPLGRRQDVPLTRFIAMGLRALIPDDAPKGTAAQLARQFGVLPTGLSQVRRDLLGVAHGTAGPYARMLGYKDELELRRAALDWWMREGAQIEAAREARLAAEAPAKSRYEAMPTVRSAAASDGIPSSFVDKFEADLKLRDQPEFSVIYDLLKASWAAHQREVPLAVRKNDQDEIEGRTAPRTPSDVAPKRRKVIGGRRK